MQQAPVTLHDDELVELAKERLGGQPVRWLYRECPGCDRLVHHSTHDHAERCEALKALVAYEVAEGRY
jgi:hypothetical protein